MEKMKHFYVFLLALALLAPACLRDMTSPQNDPEVPSVSVDAESLTRISATLEGTLPDAKDIVSYGFEMTGTNFDDAPEVVIEGTGVDEDGHFTHTVTVKPGAFYAVRTFISNGHYKKYSQDVTLKVPLTSVATPSEVSIVNNKLIASIVDDGGRDIREVGFCWSESPDKKIIRRNRLKGQLTENGTITAELPEMEAGFTYYFLAYAENATGGQEEFGYSTDPYPYLMKDENIVDIQDPAFFSYLVNRFDGNRDGRLSDQELQAVTAISVSTDQIGSLQGIEWMPQLESLECRGSAPGKGGLHTVDISQNPRLTSLDCANNQIGQLDLSGAGYLTRLDVSSNQLTELDVTGCFRLEELICSDNQLTELDLSKNPYLHQLYAGKNPFESLDLSLCTELEKFDATNCPQLSQVFVSLDQYETAGESDNFRIDSTAQFYPIFIPISDAAFLEALVSAYDRDSDRRISAYEAAAVTRIEVCTDKVRTLAGIEFFYNLEELICSSCQPQGRGQLTDLDVSHNRKLTYLDCSDNQLKSLDVSRLTFLEHLDCSNNQLSRLDVTANNVLKELLYAQNSIPTVDVSRCPLLEVLDCSSNGVKTLDVSHLTQLTELKCSHNQLEVLDVSQNSQLTTLWCEDNKMTYLDVTHNSKLTDIRCDNVPISDQVFKNKVAASYDRNRDAEISLAEAWTITRIEVCTDSIATLSGIEYFLNLEELICQSCDGQGADQSVGQLTALDVSKNEALTYLDCSSNRLTSLDVSHNPLLTHLDCSYNRLSRLDLSRNPLLTELDISSNEFTSFDVSRMTGLLEYKCSYDMLEVVDVSHNTQLTTLWCEGNKLSYLDVTNNPNLVDIRCDNVYIPDEGFKEYLVTYYDKNNDSEISLAEAFVIYAIDVNTQNIFTLEGIQSFINLQTLVCTGGSNPRERYGQLTELDLSNNRKLLLLNCRMNQLSSLDLSANTMLVSLDCSYNDMPELDLSRNPVLQTLDCGRMGLESLDVSNNPQLTELICEDNGLSELDLSRNVALVRLQCAWNSMGELDLSTNTKLEYLDFRENSLSMIDVSNNLSLNYLDARGNPNFWELILKTGQEIETLLYDSYETSQDDGITIIYV